MSFFFLFEYSKNDKNEGGRLKKKYSISFCLFTSQTEPVLHFFPLSFSFLDGDDDDDQQLTYIVNSRCHNKKKSEEGMFYSLKL
jgi:hypothetical protein